MDMPVLFAHTGKNNVASKEDAYAARIARSMWRIAKRRISTPAAQQAAALSEAAASPRNKERPPSEQLRSSGPDQDQAPENLAEFLQELAEELAKDDRGRDES